MSMTTVFASDAFWKPRRKPSQAGGKGNPNAYLRLETMVDGRTSVSEVHVSIELLPDMRWVIAGDPPALRVDRPMPCLSHH